MPHQICTDLEGEMREEKRIYTIFVLTTLRRERRGEKRNELGEHGGLDINNIVCITTKKDFRRRPPYFSI
jgi:hypothetical protein